MKLLFSVVQMIVGILVKQNEAMIALQNEVASDNLAELTETDFSDLNAKLASLSLPDSMG